VFFFDSLTLRHCLAISPSFWWWVLIDLKAQMSTFLGI